MLASCDKKTGREHVRGRLRCVQYAIPDSRNYGSNVRWEVLFDGKRVAMRSETSTCEAPPDATLEALILEFDAVRIESDKPVFTRLPDRPDNAMRACGGRCLVFGGPGLTSDGGGVQHLDTGKLDPFPNLPRGPLALSPDERTLVSAMNAYAPDQRTSFKFCVNDLDTKKAVEWTVPREPCCWPGECGTSSSPEIDANPCLTPRQAKFEWQRDATGRDVLVPPAPSPGTKNRPMPWGCPPDQAPAAPPSASP